MKDPLFEPFRINHLEVKNRICMPAMQLLMVKCGEVTEQLVEFYAARARGGAGLITVGYALVDDRAGPGNFLGAHEDRFLPGLARLSSAIKDNGAAGMVQLNHGGRYVLSSHIGGRQPLAPSPVASRLTREEPRALTLEEIAGVVRSFADAAVRVKTAGFDGVELLCGTGYLISEFLSPLTNRRTDAYGGSLENRMRFGREVVAAVRQAVGPDYPIVVRMNGNDFMPGGNSAAELREFAKGVVAAGADALNVNVGWHEAKVPQIVTSVPRGVFAYLARGIRSAVEVPVMAGHRINDPAVARELLADGLCDAVCMGRALIADPQLPTKARQGSGKGIVHCVACAQGCFDHLFKDKAVECLCNPRAGHEIDRRLEPAERPKRVLVVGGGAAGMSAALAANERGHEVLLHEAGDRLGGQLRLCGAPPGREEFLNLADDLARQVAAAGIPVTLNHGVDGEWVRTLCPDEVVLATGARPITPPIPGVERDHVVQAWDVLAGRVTTGARVVVIGGGAVGVETALYLAEKGTLSGEALKFLLVNRAEDPERLYDLATRGSKQVVLVEMLEAIGKDIGLTTRWTMLQDLERGRVAVRKGSRALEITETGVRVETGGGMEEIQADTVVIAAGSKPDTTLCEELERMKIPYRVAGDVSRIGLAFDAVHQGFLVGRGIE